MQIIDCEQGTPQWHEAKAGIPSTSEFSKIITMTGKASTQWEAYCNRLVAEKLTGSTVTTFEKTPWMERGNEFEAEAVRMYELQDDIEAQKVGFIISDGYGCSPDRLIDDDGILEVKCPAPHTHVGYMLDTIKLVKEYHVQNQGQLFVMREERKWVDLMSYYPEMAPVVVRVFPDDDYQKELEDALLKFTNKMDERLKKLGYKE